MQSNHKATVKLLQNYHIISISSIIVCRNSNHIITLLCGSMLGFIGYQYSIKLTCHCTSMFLHNQQVYLFSKVIAHQNHGLGATGYVGVGGKSAIVSGVDVVT